MTYNNRWRTFSNKLTIFGISRTELNRCLERRLYEVNIRGKK
jgi:hypothetical protein